MKTHVLLGVIIVTLVSAPAFSQAAAESALTHSMSTTSTINAASVLNRSTKQATGQLQDRLSKSVRLGPQHNDQVSQKNQVAGQQVPAQTVPKPSGANSTGKFAFCIQRSGTTCTPVARPAGSESAPSNPRGKDLSGKPTQDKYKSADTVSVPK
jgi:hypothetical protein